MTEAEWLECNDPRPMVEFLGVEFSDRKLRLFAVTCCQRMWFFLDDERLRKAVVMAERYADRLISEEQFNAARRTELLSSASSQRAAISPVFLCTRDDPNAIVETYAHSIRLLVHAKEQHAERAAQADVLRDMFGPLLFRPVCLHPAWLTLSVKQLGVAIYEEKAFDRMPILGDAMEEAGCTNAEILAHCRGPGPHVRGCWVLDLLLGKE